MIIVGPKENLVSIAVSRALANYSFSLAVANGINPTDDLTPGQQLQEAPIVNESFLSFEELIKSFTPTPTTTLRSYPNQSLYDIAAQEDGSTLAVVEWAFKNKINPTDMLTAGQTITMTQSTQRHPMIAKHFKGKGIVIATQRNVRTITLPVNIYLIPGELPYSL